MWRGRRDGDNGFCCCCESAFSEVVVVVVIAAAAAAAAVPSVIVAFAPFLRIVGMSQKQVGIEPITDLDCFEVVTGWNPPSRFLSQIGIVVVVVVFSSPPSRSSGIRSENAELALLISV